MKPGFAPGAVCRKLLQRTVGQAFYQSERAYYERPDWVQRLRTHLNQRWNERGWPTPLVLTPAECAAFWQSIGNDSASTGNRPKTYAEKSRAIVGFLHRFWNPPVASGDRILELGCNCGTNLRGLVDLGYKNLAGVEINPQAIDQMDRSFPGLRSSAEIFCGSFETVLPVLPDRSFDVVMTMGVSMHIHPRSRFIFREIARLARVFICTVEPEAANSNYVFARNYRRVFEALGFSEVRSQLLFGSEHRDLTGYNTGCVVRLLKNDRA